MKQMNERVEQWAKKAGKYKYAFLVLLVGLVLLLLLMVYLTVSDVRGLVSGLFGG